MTQKFVFMAACALAIGCSSPNTEPAANNQTASNATSQKEMERAAAVLPTPANAFVDNIEKAHAKAKLYENELIQFDLKLTFGGSVRYDGTISLTPGTDKIRFDPKEGPKAVWDGSEVFQYPDSLVKRSARFGIFTWSYFFAFPYKLSDPGTKWSETPHTMVREKTCEAMKLSFEKGTGDAPDDWYIAFADPQTHLLEAAPYIVTAGGTVDEAEEDPHAIIYSDYRAIAGIPIAHHWEFTAWNGKEGITNQLGFADLSNVRFAKIPAGFFDKPANAKADGPL